METAYYGIYDEGDVWSVSDGEVYEKEFYTLEDVVALYR